jgi:hypothetical protein
MMYVGKLGARSFSASCPPLAQSGFVVISWSLRYEVHDVCDVMQYDVVWSAITCLLHVFDFHLSCQLSFVLLIVIIYVCVSV